MVAVHLPAYLRTFAGGARTLELPVGGDTLAAVLESLWETHPGLRDRVLTETGEVRQHVNVFVAGESIRYTGGLATPVADGAAIHILPAVSGG